MVAGQQAASHVQPLSPIEGAYVVPIRAFEDERGAFMETFRREWFPWVNWDRIQSNCSISKAGVLRGLHYHHRQIDYWMVMSGNLRVAMADLRPSSETYMDTHVLELGESNHAALFIPPGVAHGFYAVTDVVLTYLVNNYYDGGRDENGVAWDDPDIGINWGIETPILSPRDAGNALLRDIPKDQLPR